MRGGGYKADGVAQRCGERCGSTAVGPLAARLSGRLRLTEGIFEAIVRDRITHVRSGSVFFVCVGYNGTSSRTLVSRGRRRNPSAHSRCVLARAFRPAFTGRFRPPIQVDILGRHSHDGGVLDENPRPYLSPCVPHFRDTDCARLTVSAPRDRHARQCLRQPDCSSIGRHPSFRERRENRATVLVRPHTRSSSRRSRIASAFRAHGVNGPSPSVACSN